MRELHKLEKALHVLECSSSQSQTLHGENDDDCSQVVEESESEDDNDLTMLSEGIFSVIYCN